MQGRPGGGKSVFCRMFSDSVRKELYPIYIPILIRLRDLDKDTLDESVDEMLSKAIARDFVTSDRGWLTDNNTRYVFFLDGFDELVLERGQSNSLSDFLEKVKKFQKGCGENAERGHRVIVTGRPFALYGIERFIPDEFIWVSLALMDEEIQAQWFSKWQSLVGEEEVTEFRSFLNDENCPQQVRELAQEPLLLYLLASMHRDSDGDENENNSYGASLNIEMLQSADADLVKVKIYQAVINWVLRKQRDEKLNIKLTQLDIEDLEIVLMEAGVCVTQTGQEYAKISMIEERLIKQGQTAAKELIEDARKSNEKDPLKNALAAFYLKAATGQDNSVEFFHKSFGEFLMARRLTESFWSWTEKGRKGRGYVIKDDDLNKEIYDLLGYGHLTVEVLDYVMPLLKQGEKQEKDHDDEKDKYIPTDWVTLYERLYCFYLDWSDGIFINAYNEILPLNKARELKDYDIMVGQQTVDIYTGLNVMLLLLAINSYAQGQDSLKEKIYFHPCGDVDNEEEFKKSRLLKIMGYINCLGVGIFKLGQFLSNANLSNAYLSNAYLRNANLSNAYLSNANLRNANLSNANFSNANLRNANLSNANFSNANLRYANLRYADLSNADLEDITWNEDTNWKGVKGLETARNVPKALREQLQL
ncbi:MAG: pentapeptide repeat-containing protein [Crocosphaera sp.]